MHPWVVISISAIFSGLVAIAVTLAIEKWGGVIGGGMGTMPTTIVPAAFGLRMNLGASEAFSEAMWTAPVGMLVNAGFLLLWRVIPRPLPRWSLFARLTVMVVLSLAAWFVGAMVVVHVMSGLRGMTKVMAGVGIAVTAVIALMGVITCFQPVAAPKGRHAVGMMTMLARGGLAAAAVALSVGLASVGGTVSAGIASVFPAIFLTTMVGLWVAQGEAVPAGAVGPMMLGSTSVAVFALVSSQSMRWLGAGWGALLAWVVAVLFVTIPTVLWLSHGGRMRMSRMAR
ncbi:MAG TPA: hypothetical protein PLJ27_19830 [Polyangiaceae bacterium]|nr:hypothetical protein [Polyangiaceae bacterium]